MKSNFKHFFRIMLILFAASLISAAQTTINDDDAEVISVKTDLVVVTGVVANEKHELTADDVQIFADGAAQKIEYVDAR